MVPHPQTTNGLSDGLLRASAETAAQAILVTPLASTGLLEDEHEDMRLAAKVKRGEQGTQPSNVKHGIQTPLACAIHGFTTIVASCCRGVTHAPHCSTAKNAARSHNPVPLHIWPGFTLVQLRSEPAVPLYLPPHTYSTSTV